MSKSAAARVDEILPNLGTAKLSALRFGHDSDAGEDINARIVNREPDDALKASVEAYGVIVPMVVVRRPKGIFVVDGNRRLAALNAFPGFVDQDVEVPIIMVDAPNGLALELSLVTNLIRADLHPVDEYEAFAALKDQTPEDIAKKFGRTTRDIEQALALGALAPEIRLAWREGAISTEAAQAFTLAGEHKTQVRVLDKLRKAKLSITRGVVRHELKADATDAAKLVNFIGVPTYEAEGGKLVRDLFEDRHIILNPNLAKQMADAKLAGICNDLIGKGWAWAQLASDVPRGAVYSWGRIDPKLMPTAQEKAEIVRLHSIIDDPNNSTDVIMDAEELVEAMNGAIRARAFTDAQRKRSGCIVSLVEPGIIQIATGMLKPAERAKDSGTDKAPAPKDGPKAKEAKTDGALPRALVHRLSQTLTKAAADVMCDAPVQIMLAAVVAGFQGHGAAPVCVGERGMASKLSGIARTTATFEGAFKGALKRKAAHLTKALAEICAQALDLQEPDGFLPLKRAGTAALLAELPAAALREATIRHFDAADYFSSINAAAVLAALKAMGVSKLKSNKKADLAKIAAAEAKKQKWLPPELSVGGKKSAARRR